MVKRIMQREGPSSLLLISLINFLFIYFCKAKELMMHISADYFHESWLNSSVWVWQPIAALMLIQK